MRNSMQTTGWCAQTVTSGWDLASSYCTQWGRELHPTMASASCLPLGSALLLAPQRPETTTKLHFCKRTGFSTCVNHRRHVSFHITVTYFEYSQKLKLIHQKNLLMYLTWNDFERDIRRWYLCLFHFRTWQCIQRRRRNARKGAKTQENTSLGLSCKGSHITPITKTSRITTLLSSSIALTCWWFCKRWITNLEANLRAMLWTSVLRKQGKGHIKKRSYFCCHFTSRKKNPASF